MATTYTQFDGASDRLARTSWDEDEFLGAIDRRMNKRDKRTTKRTKQEKLMEVLRVQIVAEY